MARKLACVPSDFFQDLIDPGADVLHVGFVQVLPARHGGQRLHGGIVVIEAVDLQAHAGNLHFLQRVSCGLVGRDGRREQHQLRLQGHDGLQIQLFRGADHLCFAVDALQLHGVLGGAGELAARQQPEIRHGPVRGHHALRRLRVIRRRPARAGAETAQHTYGQQYGKGSFYHGALPSGELAADVALGENG